MNAEQLLEVYEQISEAPDAIARLRTFVLNLAVRGKVGTGIPEESPLEEYEMNPEWDWLPENWRALNFGSHCDIQGGNQPPKSQFTSEPKDGYVRLFQIRDLGANPVPVYIPENSTRRLCKEGEILIGRYGASVGKIFWAQTGAYNVALAKFIWPDDALTPEFCFLLLKSDLFQTCLEGASRSAQAGFNKGDLAAVNFPLPPLAEQNRIVAKVDELMALCDRLEEVHKAREETRDKLTAASLARLTARETTAEDFPAHAAFALEALPALTTRPDQIKTLRQTILNLAVRGKLVEQDPADEPASASLVSIAEAREADASRKSKRARGLPRVSDAEASELPTGWESVRLSDIAISMRYGTSTKCGADASLVPVLRIPNVSSGYVTLDDMKFGPLSEREHEDLALASGDLLMIRSNGSLGIVGRSAVVPTEANGMAFAGYLVRLRTAIEHVNTTYVWMAMNSQPIRDQIEKPIRSAVGLKNVNLTEFGNLSFWLPPLAEQHRIVAKVEALMALCDRLEAALTTVDTTRTRLLEALLQEALEPGSEVLEAAE